HKGTELARRRRRLATRCRPERFRARSVTVAAERMVINVRGLRQLTRQRVHHIREIPLGISRSPGLTPWDARSESVQKNARHRWIGLLRQRLNRCLKPLETMLEPDVAKQPFIWPGPIHLAVMRLIERRSQYPV